MYVIKAIYPSGGHTVMLNGQSMQFKEREAALAHAEILTGEMKKVNIETSYIVVEDSL